MVNRRAFLIGAGVTFGATILPSGKRMLTEQTLEEIAYEWQSYGVPLRIADSDLCQLMTKAIARSRERMEANLMNRAFAAVRMTADENGLHIKGITHEELYHDN